MMQIHITAITFRMLAIAADAHRCTANCMVSSRHYNWIYKLFCIRTPLCAFHARRTHHGTSLAHDGIIHTMALPVCISYCVSPRDVPTCDAKGMQGGVPRRCRRRPAYACTRHSSKQDTTWTYPATEWKAAMHAARHVHRHCC